MPSLDLLSYADVPHTLTGLYKGERGEAKMFKRKERKIQAGRRRKEGREKAMTSDKLAGFLLWGKAIGLVLIHYEFVNCAPNFFNVTPEHAFHFLEQSPGKCPTEKSRLLLPKTVPVCYLPPNLSEEYQVCWQECVDS